ncbi:hypothetical protein AALA69_07675 [Eggerthellaceae bacterium 24-137]
MSHFAVAVISDGTKRVSELLAPYQENNMGDCPKEYLEFHNVEDEYRQQYENDGATYVFMPDGRRLLPWDEEFRVDGSFGFGSETYEVPEHLERRWIPHKETFAAFDDYMREWCDYENDPDAGAYGYWENPNAKWDWWLCGGRWRAQVRASKGDCAPYPKYNFDGETTWEEATDYPPGHFDQAKLGDMIWDRDEADEKRLNDQWRAWVDGEEVEGLDDPPPLAAIRVKQYGDRETYVLCNSTMWWRAVITPDGKWHEIGEMGWWGMSSESGGELVEWARAFKERFIDPYPPEYVLTVIDCHI